MGNKVGIVILNYNGSEFVDIALDSLLRAKCDQKFEVGVIDNGSKRKDAEKCKQICEKYFDDSKLKGFFVRSESGLGFSGGNNVVIKRFLEDAEISHICLLNSDVIVTDGWLDRLISTGADAVGPVTNATGNEQTVSIDYTAEPSKNAFNTINEYAEKRYAVYGDYCTETDMLNFFCTVFSRESIEKIGFLDERFFPGSYEDNDFCLRLQRAGISLVISRGTFVHHFGSGSFSKLPMYARIGIANDNKTRFEKKWNIQTEDTTWKLLESIKQDCAFFSGKKADAWAIKLIESSIKDSEKMISKWAKQMEFLLSEKAVNSSQTAKSVISAEICGIESMTGREMLKLAMKKLLRKIKRVLCGKPAAPAVLVGAEAYTGRELLWLAYKKLCKKIKGGNKNNKNEFLSVSESADVKMPSDMVSLFKRLSSQKSICIFAPVFTRENEKDGYIQRISAIDATVLGDYFKIYLMGEEKRVDEVTIESVDLKHAVVKFNSHDPEQRKQIFAMVKACKRMYVHSVLRFMPDIVSEEMQKILEMDNVFKVWDVHGSVPEEYQMNESFYGADLANAVEEKLYKKSDVIICVNEAMKNHLQKKYGKNRANFVVLPIFNVNLSERGDEAGCRDSEKPVFVYSGGLQKWQNIGLMQDVIEKTSDRYQYKIFVPDTDAFKTMWGSRKGINQIVLESKRPNELAEEYKKCHYGFVLRDDIVVNNVACPTKIIEYLQYGIVPVLKTDKIGDFAALGMNYITYEDVLADRLPQEAEYRRMVEENYGVLDSLAGQKKSGEEKLKALITDACRPVVGLVVTSFDKGGLEQVVLNLYNGYKNAGIKTYLLCEKDILGPMAEQIENNDLFVFNSDLEYFEDLVDRLHITVLHYHYNTFGLKRMRLKGVRTLYTMHNVYIWKSKEELKSYAEILKYANAIIPVSDFVSDYFVDRTNYTEGNVQTIYNGIDFDELSCNDLSPELSREAIGVSKDDIVFAFVASFYPAKGQIGMIGVMEQLAKQDKRIKLLLVGNVGDPAYYDKYQEALKGSDAKESIIQIPYFAHKYMGQFLRESVDVFILPTLQEGCSNAVLEAIYCDKPMILTNVGNAKEAGELDSCIVVKTAYDDVSALTNEQLIATALEKDMKNQSDVVMAIKTMADNLELYKSRAVLTPEQKEVYSTGYMVKQYIDLIESFF